MKVKCISAEDFSGCDACPHGIEHEKVIDCELTYCTHSNRVKVKCIPLDEEGKPYK